MSVSYGPSCATKLEYPGVRHLRLVWWFGFLRNFRKPAVTRVRTALINRLGGCTSNGNVLNHVAEQRMLFADPIRHCKLRQSRVCGIDSEPLYKLQHNETTRAPS